VKISPCPQRLNERLNKKLQKQGGKEMVQSTRKRLRACEPKRRTQLIWIDDPHATDADRERARQRAIADGWIKEADDVTFVSWKG